MTNTATTARPARAFPMDWKHADFLPVTRIAHIMRDAEGAMWDTDDPSVALSLIDKAEGIVATIASTMIRESWERVVAAERETVRILFA